MINHDIRGVLPHRYPFLLVDRVIESETGRWAKGYKNVSWNEWFMAGSADSMPGMLLIEALAQLGAFASAGGSGKGGLGFLSSFKGIEFTGAARPGDRVDLYYEVVRSKRGFVLGKGQASVDGSVIVKAEEILVYYAEQ